MPLTPEGKYPECPESQHLVLNEAGIEDGNDHVWHPTGSDKTLSSFKAATLLKENATIHKCVFVVEGKDLDKPSVLVLQRVTATGQRRTRGKTFEQLELQS